MGEKAIVNRINKINELQKEVDEILAIIDGIKDELKADMTEKATDEIKAGDYTMRYKTVISNRLDSKSLKADLPDIYGKYTKETESKRFTIN